MNKPRLFDNPDNTSTMSLINLLGSISAVLISFVVLFFFLKRAPMVIGSIWRGQAASHRNLVFFIPKVLYSVYLLFSDGDILYYFMQLFCVILGLFAHPFFYAGLLTDILRFKILYNVVRAIYEPRIEMGLSFLLFVILQYYFTIFTYLVLYD